MCGIYGYIGKEKALFHVFDGLKRLEYRGYDSSGIAYVDKNGKIKIIKSIGEVENLKNKINFCEKVNLAIGHTRWATHGKPDIKNCHPHFSEHFALVHNGIIENYKDLKSQLNYKFYSETDTEVIAKLLEENYKKLINNSNKEISILNIIKNSLDKLKGSFAVALIYKNNPQNIYVFKKNSPLVIAKNNQESFISSDINAINNCFEYYSLSDMDIAEIGENYIKIYDENLNLINKKKIKKKALNYLTSKKYSHNMLKEINEIPIALEHIYKEFQTKNFFNISKKIKEYKNITIVGCGTAYHAGLYGKYILEKYLNKKIYSELSSEFKYKNIIINKNDLVIGISQSGETADTISALERAKSKGASILVITNTPNSTMTRLADYLIVCNTGPEFGVAATKSYVSQIYTLYGLACLSINKKINNSVINSSKKLLREIDKFEFCKFYNKEKFFFIGRLFDSVTAFEGALKLKEISYVHSEGYCAGELKHGTLSLIDEKSLVIAIITQDSIKEKSINAIHEVKARGAEVLVITQFKDFKQLDNIIELPLIEEDILSVLSIIPLQLFAFNFSLMKGLNPDKPRNLAKSVTVE